MHKMSPASRVVPPCLRPCIVLSVFEERQECGDGLALIEVSNMQFSRKKKKKETSSYKAWIWSIMKETQCAKFLQKPLPIFMLKTLNFVKSYIAICCIYSQNHIHHHKKSKDFSRNLGKSPSSPLCAISCAYLFQVIFSRISESSLPLFHVHSN